ncbi:MAG: MGMT family protein [Brumimicrobium sp.]|nr:MGMT family protein [Brumimicrobium sp.]
MAFTEKLSEQNKDFFEKVYEIVRLIPKGRVTTYGSIAKALGSPKSSRMVGWAMNASHKDPTVPAHRVVNRNGVLSGKMHFESPTAMEERLKNENVLIKNDAVQNFQKVFWDVQKELTGL